MGRRWMGITVRSPSRSRLPDDPAEDRECGRCTGSDSPWTCRECREDIAEQEEHDRAAWERSQGVDLG